MIYITVTGCFSRFKKNGNCHFFMFDYDVMFCEAPALCLVENAGGSGGAELCSPALSSQY